MQAGNGFLLLLPPPGRRVYSRPGQARCPPTRTCLQLKGDGFALWGHSELIFILKNKTNQTLHPHVTCAGYRMLVPPGPMGRARPPHPGPAPGLGLGPRVQIRDQVGEVSLGLCSLLFTRAGDDRNRLCLGATRPGLLQSRVPGIPPLSWSHRVPAGRGGLLPAHPAAASGPWVGVVGRQALAQSFCFD